METTKVRRPYRILPALVVLATLLATLSLASSLDTTAVHVLGQVDFVHNAENLVDGRGLAFPGIAIDASVFPNRLYVADYGNNRVLAWNDVGSFADGASADLVIGQPDFISSAANNGGVSADSLNAPDAVAVDASGNLYVSDSGNNRALEYNTPFAACESFPCVGGGANLVFGQGGSFTSNIENKGGVSANSLNHPNDMAVDASGNLYVADYYNNRVLEYNTPLSTDTTADAVFGQGGSFTSTAANNGGLSASSLSSPSGVAVDAGGNLYIADSGNNRVLEYNTPLATDTMADKVFGQGGSFTSATANNGGLSANSLNVPSGLAVDAAGDLYVADTANNRVLEYNTPLSTDTTADMVFGQGGSFTSWNSNEGGVSADSLAQPFGVAVDVSGNLYIADTFNHRVLEYDTPLSTDTTADRELGQVDFLHNTENLVDRRGLGRPWMLAIDTSVTPNRLYVTDSDNNRILAWKDVTAIADGAPADLVIGQPDFFSNAPGVGADNLDLPFGVAVDAAGNLYVADSHNSRVLNTILPSLRVRRSPV